jgi:predicted P-loop ATPase
MTTRPSFKSYTDQQISQGFESFKEALGIGATKKKQWQTAYDYLGASHKLGCESIYSLSVLESLDKVGIGPGQAIVKLAGADLNLFVTTGAYAKAGITQAKTSPNYVALDGKDCLKVMNLFFEIDLKDEKRTWYHNELKHGQVTHDLAQFIEKEIAHLKSIKEIGQAPSMVLLSKNGLHFHFNLALTSGWSHAGIQYLLDLPTQAQEQFCADAGISSIGAIEPQYFDGKESNCIRNWWKKVYEKNNLKDRDYDDAILDIGSRKCREAGMFHTKDINTPWIMRPYYTSSYSQSLIKPTIAQPTQKEEKSKFRLLMEKVIDGKTPHRHLDGSEMISIGATGKKAQVKHESITVQELANNWDSYVSDFGVKGDKIQACLDFLSPEMPKPYESIGGAFVNKSEDGALMIHLVHPMKPKTASGNQISLFVLPTDKQATKMKNKVISATLALDIDAKTGKIEKSETNLRIILQKDQLITSIYKLDILRGQMVVHHAIKTSSTSPSSCIELDQPIAQQISSKIKNKAFCKMKAREMQDEDFIVLQAHIKQVYGVEYPRPQIIENIKACFSTNPNMNVKFNLVHEKFLGHYEKWVKAGRPQMLDTWLPDTLQVSKTINEAYYNHLSMVGRKLLIGLTSRAYSFSDPTKLEMMLCITGKSQGTGKSTFSETLVRSLLDLFGVETATAGHMDSRFILSTRQDDNKSGDKILSYEGKLVYQLEEFGTDQVGKKSANQLKNQISEKSVEGRSAYERFNRSLNFTHFIISTTNDRYFLHEGDGDQRRFLILDLDYVGTDGYYAIPLDGIKKPVNFLKGNEGFIDRDLMASLLNLAFGEAFARAIHGEIQPGTAKDLLAVRSAKDVLTGQPTDQEIVCEMPRLSMDEKAKVAAFNKRYEMGSERMKDALIKFFKDQGENNFSFKYHALEAGVKEEIGFVKHQNQVIEAMGSLEYPLVKVDRKVGGTCWQFVAKDGKSLLDFNPYAGLRDDEEESKTLRAVREHDLTVRSLEQKIKELEEALKKQQSIVVKEPEIIILDKAQSFDTFTPEIEEKDDDDDFSWEIVPSIAQITSQSSYTPIDVNADVNELLAHNRAVQKSNFEQGAQHIAQYNNKPKVDLPKPPPKRLQKDDPYINPLDDIDENNLDPEIVKNILKTFSKD